MGASRGLAELVAGVRDWEGLLHSAACAQLRPRLSALLGRVALPPGGRAIAQDLAHVARAHEGRARLLAAELTRILAALREARLKAAPFKGPAFAAWMGRTGVAREMNDLDLLVHERDLGAAVQALRPLGYAPLLAGQAVASRWLTRVTNELPLGAGGAPLLLELHWRLAPPWFPATATVAQVLEGASERALTGSSAWCPSPEALLLLHVSDGIKSHGASLRGVADLADILRAHPAIDWNRVTGIARANAALDTVRISVALVEDLAAEAAAALEAPAIALELAPGARALADEARRSSRLSGAVRMLRRGLAQGPSEAGASRHFAWAVRVADHPLRALAAVMRHLAGPSVADLEAMPRDGCTDARLRAAAWRRRLAGAVR